MCGVAVLWLLLLLRPAVALRLLCSRQWTSRQPRLLWSSTTCPAGTGRPPSPSKFRVVPDAGR